jgi:UDP:flavonoid glycosyltransferase YjiC (YdhE family)
MLERVLGEDSFRERCGELQKKLVRLEGSEHGADVLEELLERPDAPGLKSAP